jgi:hypothetical protein
MSGRYRLDIICRAVPAGGRGRYNVLNNGLGSCISHQAATGSTPRSSGYSCGASFPFPDSRISSLLLHTSKMSINAATTSSSQRTLRRIAPAVPQSRKITPDAPTRQVALLPRKAPTKAACNACRRRKSKVSAVLRST